MPENINHHQLPEGWRWVRLRELCRFVNGDAYKESDWSGEGTPIIRIQNLNDHSKPFNYWAEGLDDRVVVKPGNVLLAWSGTPGTSFGVHIWNRGLAVLNQHIFRVDFQSDQISPEWSVIAINHQLEVLIGKAHGGVGLRHVTKGEVESLAIPLPAPREQKRIAAILSEQLGAVERARAAAEAQLEAAKALPAAYLRAVFSSPEAQQWTRKRLDDVSKLLPSKSIATDGDAEVQAVTTACLSEGGFLTAGMKTARMWSKDIFECTLSRGEILVARSNTPELVGRVAMFLGEPKGAVASDLTIRIWPTNDITAEFLTAYLSFLYQTGYWKERAGGASGSMKKITREQIHAQEIPVPDIVSQERIAVTLNSQMVSAERARKAIDEELYAIKRMPAALLRRAFSGAL